jgi:hypothetical protein
MTIGSDGLRTRHLLEDIAGEFPDFSIRKKRDSRLQKAIHVVLVAVTLGGQRTYLTRYHTVLWGTLWVPDAWDEMTDDERFILLRHERVHLRQRKRMGDALMSFLYLVPFLPVGLAYGRARIEWEAYVETLRATAEVHGLAAAESLRAGIVERFTGPDYGWMWPFPAAIRAWFDEAMRDLHRALPDPAEKRDRSPGND